MSLVTFPLTHIGETVALSFKAIPLPKENNIRKYTLTISLQTDLVN